MSTNVRQFCFPCKLVNLTSWSISLLPPVVLLYCIPVVLYNLSEKIIKNEPFLNFQVILLKCVKENVNGRYNLS